MTATLASTNNHTPPAFEVSVRRRSVMTTEQVDAANVYLDDKSPSEIIRWAFDTFAGRVALTASFGDTTMIDLATKVDPDIEVVFLDTGFHFAETLETVRRAMERYELNLKVLRPDVAAADVWSSGPEACCASRKVDPLDRYLSQHVDAWLSGLRRDDDPGRAGAATVSIDRRGLVKVNPIVSMTDAEYLAYSNENDVIVNSLQFDGYASIGCWPCTERSTEGRSGRWNGTGKTECGLHL